MHLLQSDIQALVDLVDEASHAIMQVYGSDFSAKVKSDASPLTQADLIANEILLSGLKGRWPEIPILSEEVDPLGVLEKSNCYWAVDPLDGTKEFIKKNGEFTVNIALICDGVPEFGIVAAPALDVLYWGGSRYGAQKRQGAKWSLLSPIANEPNWQNQDFPLKVVASRSHPSPELEGWLVQYPRHQLLEVGSSLKLCKVAEGLADCYPRLAPTCIWDIAAGHAILNGVGGQAWVWPLDQRVALTYDDPHEPINPSFIATGPILM